MCYIEMNLMSLDRDLYDGTEDTLTVLEEDRSPSALDVYVFLWNRYRMIAKDFILQNYRSLSLLSFPLPPLFPLQLPSLPPSLPPPDVLCLPPQIWWETG
jgi:hypothetical protein